ncbi:MAG: hypothetical protein NC206_08425 [Bacteroides sp.]|nr:hypothetical protein [Roseburia sp.]MCM1347094.1 hypothetical protein [Bacteroides sp.]MCM1421615.1 hypothetical protein [Bacteroides sp.]
MKKLGFTIIAFLMTAVLFETAAQESAVNFMAGTPKSERLTDEQKEAVKQKVEKIIARNNAGAVTLTDAFVIEPELSLGQAKKTDGLLRDVSLVTGEFSLVVHNKYDGSVYNSVTVDVKASAVGSESEAINSLIKSIKVTDPVYVRFIRNARKRIAEYYETNGLPLPERRDEQPEAAADPEEELLTEELEQEPVVEEPVAEPVVEPETEPAPVVEEPKVQKNKYTVEIGSDELGFELLYCKGNRASNTVRINYRVVNNERDNSVDFVLSAAFAPEGVELTRWTFVDAHGYKTDRWNNRMPKGVAVGRVLELQNVTKEYAELPLVELKVGDYKIVIRNLPVEW